MITRREFLQSSFLFPLVTALPKPQLKQDTQGFAFPMYFAETTKQATHNAVQTISFKQLNLWQLITRFIK